MPPRHRTAPLAAALGASLAWTALAVGVAPATGRDVTYLEAAPVVEAAGSAAPREIGQLPPAARPGAWPGWVASRREATTARLLRGEEDSLVPLLLFGTSYTKAPRITGAFLEKAAKSAPPNEPASHATERALASAFEPRVDDLLRALERPGTNERLAWARATLERLGHRLGTPQARARAGAYLVENFARVTRESGELAAVLLASDAAPGSTSDRAQVFAHRGLAPDTSWPINFAVHEALASVVSSGVLAPRSVARVAVVGPGLDFVDKDEGFDHYPPQCLQPFAVLDALVAFGLSSASGVHVTTFDVSPRVNAHVRGFAARPPSRPYDLQLVRRADVPWTPAASRYFETFGMAIGSPAAPAKPLEAAGLVDARAVRVSPAALRRVLAQELDIVHQRLNVAEHERFDLVLATNVLLYYDRFEQALAARSIEAMLGPAGLLLTNTEIDDVPAFPLRRVSRTTHVFSARPGDGEVVIAYRR
jgi:hypothetical protein